MDTQPQPGSQVDAGFPISEGRKEQILNLDNLLDAFIGTDREGLINAWSFHAQEIFGWSSDEALGRAVWMHHVTQALFATAGCASCSESRSGIFLYERREFVIKLENSGLVWSNGNLMKPRSLISGTVVCLFLSTSLFAAKITGKVTNGTTGKSAAGEEVVLLSLAGGMDEVSRATTGADGGFTLDVPDESSQHLVRVSRQGVNYFRAAPPGTTSLDITVYDAAKTVNNLVSEGRVLRVQASNNELEVSEMYVLRNESNPPRAWMGDHTLEIDLPEGAKVEEALAAGPGGMPITTSPVPTGKPNHYAFVYPIRPGRTQLQVIYKLPYTGSRDFNMTPGMPLSELGVMLPKSMHFNSRDEVFSPATDEDGMTVFVAKSLPAGQNVKFSISGEGSAPREAQGGGGEGASASPAPGGGLGPPIGSPEPLGNSRWYILGGVIVIVAAFAIWMVRRKPGTEALVPAGSATPARTPSARRDVSRGEAYAPWSNESTGSVLDALKEELFQLETDRLQGKISQQDYAAAKAGLDTLFRRQMKKNDDAGRN